jgi:hypothetical protein
MSINALEKALWQAYVNPADTQRFKADARSYLKTFKLDETERALSASWDIRGMVAHGVNPLLIMMAFQTVKGVDKMPEYFMTINQKGASAPAA